MQLFSSTQSRRNATPAPHKGFRPFLAALAGALVAWSPPLAANAAGVLHIYNWSDYTSPELIAKFEKDTGIKVTIDTYDSNETLLAKLKSGATGYDIAMPTHDFVPILIKEGLLEEIDAPKLSGYDNLDKEWQGPEWDPGNKYSIPWDWGTTSFVVDTTATNVATDTLKSLFDPPEELKGKIGMFSSSSEAIALALVYLNKPQCSSDVDVLKQVQQVLQKQKDFVKAYDSNGVMDRVLSGETTVQQIASGEAVRINRQRQDIKFVFAKEGGTAWMDNVVVPKGAPDIDSAKAFLSFMMQPENAALQAKFAGYPVGVKGADAYLPKDLTGAPSFVPPADWKKVFLKVCGPEAVKGYDLIWTKLRG